jgi:hypothetical protein
MGPLFEGTWGSLFHGGRNKSSLDYRAVNFRALSPYGEISKTSIKCTLLRSFELG